MLVNVGPVNIVRLCWNLFWVCLAILAQSSEGVKVGGAPGAADRQVTPAAEWLPAGQDRLSWRALAVPAPAAFASFFMAARTLTQPHRCSHGRCCTWNSHRPPAPKATGWSFLSYYTRSGSAPAKSPSRLPSAKSPDRQRLLRGSMQHNTASVMPPLIGNKTTACLGRAAQLLFWSNSSSFHFAAPFEPSQGHRDDPTCAQWKRVAQLLTTAATLLSHPGKPLCFCRELSYLLLPNHELSPSRWTCSPGSWPEMSSLNDHVKERTSVNLENMESYVRNLPVGNTSIQGLQYSI